MFGQLVLQLLDPRGIEFIGRRAVEFIPFAVQVQRVMSFMVEGKEFPRHSRRAGKLEDLGDDHRPAKQRDDYECSDGNLPFGGCLVEGELQRAGGKYWSYGECCHYRG